MDSIEIPSLDTKLEHTRTTIGQQKVNTHKKSHPSQLSN